MRRIIKVLLLSTVLGFVGLAASSTREPWGVSQFHPFGASYPNDCTGKLVNPFNGCGYYYDPLMIALDYLFWLGIAVVGVSIIGIFRNHLAPTRNAKQPTGDFLDSLI